MASDVIAIDGPAASGKSTVARRVAQRLGYLYVDSGAVYRGLTWKVLQCGRDAHAPGEVVAVMRAASVQFREESGAVRFDIDGEDPGAAIRSAEVNENVSAVAAVEDVRRQVSTWLRSLVRFGNLVMEGRDIGTVVFPDAPHKFYLDADPEVRAQRRHREASSGQAVSKRAIQESLARRDARDSGRKAAPLKVAEGAIVVDTTDLDIGAVAEAVLGHIGAGDGVRP